MSTKQIATLTASELEILEVVSEYKFLTAWQVTRLKYGAKSLTYAQDRLKRLTEKGVLLRRLLPHLGAGNTEYLYYLSPSGQHVLMDRGFEFGGRVRKDDIEDMGLYHLQHCLSVNDFLIAGRLLQRSVPAIQLVTWYHDLDLKQTPVRVQVDSRVHSGKETVSVVPDAFLLFQSGEKERAICLELDRGTTDQRRVRMKMAALYSYALSPEYKKLFGTERCMVAFATTAGQQRLNNLLSWCEQELTALDITEESNLYRFSSFSDTLHPGTLFCSPRVWFRPFDPSPTPLLWSV